MRYLRLFFALLLPLAFSVRAQSDLEYAKALTVVYASGKSLEYLKGWCDRRAPSTAADSARALAAWKTQYRFAVVETEVARILSAAQKNQLQTSLEAARAKLEDSLDAQVKDPLKECQGFEAYINENANLRRAYPNEMQLLDARLPAAGGSSGAVKPTPAPSAPSPSPASPSSPAAQGVVYTVAQIGAVYEGAYRKASGDGSAKRKAGEAAIRALGKRLYVTGTLNDDGRWLEYQNAKFESENDVNCDNFINENEDFPGKKSGGKPFTILGTFSEYDVFFDFKDCQIVPSLAGLKPSSLDATLGLRRKALPPETFLVNPGAGLKDSQIQGLYLHQTSVMGVGGYMYVAYEPWLLLKDGSIYNDPTLAPNRFNAARSKQDEPQKWGRWTAQGGDKFLIRWNDDSDGQPDRESLNKTSPGSSNQKLNGYFERISGSGNTAFGGNTSVAAYSGYTFSPDGTFTFDSGAGGSTGNDFTGNSPNVSFSNTSATKKGSYKISGYNLELRYPDGKIVSRSFCMAGDKKDPTSLIYLGGTYYLKK